MLIRVDPDPKHCVVKDDNIAGCHVVQNDSISGCNVDTMTVLQDVM